MNARYVVNATAKQKTALFPGDQCSWTQRRANAYSVITMLEQVCSVLRVSKELWTDNGPNFCNTQVDHWRSSTEWSYEDLFFSVYTPGQWGGQTDHWTS